MTATTNRSIISLTRKWRPKVPTFFKKVSPKTMETQTAIKTFCLLKIKMTASQEALTISWTRKVAVWAAPNGSSRTKCETLEAAPENRKHSHHNKRNTRKRVWENRLIKRSIDLRLTNWTRCLASMSRESRRLVGFSNKNLAALKIYNNSRELKMSIKISNNSKRGKADFQINISIQQRQVGIRSSNRNPSSRKSRFIRVGIKKLWLNNTLKRQFNHNRNGAKVQVPRIRHQL